MKECHRKNKVERGRQRKRVRIHLIALAQPLQESKIQLCKNKTSKNFTHLLCKQIKVEKEGQEKKQGFTLVNSKSVCRISLSLLLSSTLFPSLCPMQKFQSTSSHLFSQSILFASLTSILFYFCHSLGIRHLLHKWIIHSHSLSEVLHIRFQ